jgi:hypothetical protein
MPGAMAAQLSLQSGSVIEAAERLRSGEYLWAPEIAPEGPVLLVVSLATQRAVIYRNGIPIGITTVSTGRPGHATPTGIFTVLQRRIEHYSSLYNNAPMPYMQPSSPACASPGTARNRPGCAARPLQAPCTSR